MSIKHNLLLLLTLFITVNLSAQNQLISPFLGDITANQPASNFLMQQPETISIEYIDLNLSILNSTTNVQLTFDDQNYTVNNDSIVVRDTQDYSWFGTNANGDGYIIISVLGNDVQGIIRKGLETYELLTTSMNQRKVITKIEQGAFPEEYCVFDTEIEEEPFGGLYPNSSTLKKALDTGCPIRALIMFTPAAEADLT